MYTATYVVLTHKEAERRRHEAMRLFFAGAASVQIANRFGVHRTTVWRWRQQEIVRLRALFAGAPLGHTVRAA